MRRQISLVLIVVIGTLLSAVALGANPQTPTKARKPGAYAIFDTSMGTFVCVLFEKMTPETVKKFEGLAEGTKEWRNTRGEARRGVPYYNGTIFHRVIKNFMIQGGDITGAGTFSPVPQFGDEFVETLRFDRPGMLAMANAGPNTNGSQFFITVAPATYLNGKHTIFGRVVEGYEVVRKISRVPVEANDKPVNKVVINKITIEDVDKPAKNSK